MICWLIGHNYFWEDEDDGRVHYLFCERCGQTRVLSVDGDGDLVNAYIVDWDRK